jgi:hypothetical protein
MTHAHPICSLYELRLHAVIALVLLPCGSFHPCAEERGGQGWLLPNWPPNIHSERRAA